MQRNRFPKKKNFWNVKTCQIDVVLNRGLCNVWVQCENKEKWEKINSKEIIPQTGSDIDSTEVKSTTKQFYSLDKIPFHGFKWINARGPFQRWKNICSSLGK